ncbi:septal ring lytic transglycosylase RlpA family protein [Allorhizobium sp. BGMRC 0089]|uniref:septal ring lytic transglycosylase RlpA family protein n=1 Tax=Allorhizobium sonneratiae TaxID=2934936 RepID=UPI002033FE5A|nr:septal ring lytic transglycosylase RlpA family protein [Allorhizobium sonneratiae]MCM2292846.1 septal ring lytic transglycosylase RlpA family protein [Allorhizobium sonneratiae]
MGVRVLKLSNYAVVGFRLASLLFAGVAVSSCGTAETGKTAYRKHGKEYFAESAYGVKASKRVVENGPVPKGGGRRLIGDPYTVAGKVYTPRENPGYDKVGLASWYGSAFHGRYTANGEIYDQYSISAASPTMPLPSYARVTNLDTGSSLIVRVNDRGPFHQNRLIDLSQRAAELLDVRGHGTAHVRVKYVGPAPLEGNDAPYMLASYIHKGDRGPRITPDGGYGSDVMVASNSNTNTLENFFDRLGGGSSRPTPVRSERVTHTRSSNVEAVAYRKPASQPSIQPNLVASADLPVPVVRQSPSVQRAPSSQRWQPSAAPVAVARQPVRTAAVEPVAYSAPRAAASYRRPVEHKSFNAPASNGGLPPGWHVGAQPVSFTGSGDG